jgi:hypothetical protein
MKFLQLFSWFTRIGIARIEKSDQELSRPVRWKGKRYQEKSPRPGAYENQTGK